MAVVTGTAPLATTDDDCHQVGCAEAGRERQQLQHQLGVLYEAGPKRFDGDGIFFAVLPFACLQSGEN